MSMPLVILLGFMQAQPRPAEYLRFVQPQVNLGELRSHVARSQRFEFVNQGPEPIEIIRVEPSCGCMAVKLDRRRFQPGEKGELTLEIRPTTQITGVQSWFAKVEYQTGSAGAARSLQLQLQAVVRHEVTVTPAALVWSGTGSREIIVTDRRDPPRTVTGLHFSSPLIAAKIMSAEKGNCRIVLQAAAALPLGRRDEMLTIYVDDPAYGEIQVPVTLIAQARAAVNFAPEQISHRIAAGQPIPSTLIRLRPAGERAVVVHGVTANDPAITCTWAQGPGNEATLKIQVSSAKLGDRDLDGTVRVQLREPVDEVLTIPVRVSR
jgi:Protein of unknown function (DUF1573)